MPAQREGGRERKREMREKEGGEGKRGQLSQLGPARSGLVVQFGPVRTGPVVMC